MAWIQPKTDWVQSDHVTHEDLNRIFGNINHLAGSSLKADYTQDDFLTSANWNALISRLRTLELATRVVTEAVETRPGALPGTDMTSATFNAAEIYMQALYERLGYMFNQQKAVCYTGDPVYASEVPDTFSRGM